MVDVGCLLTDLRSASSKDKLVTASPSQIMGLNITAKRQSEKRQIQPLKS